MAQPHSTKIAVSNLAPEHLDAFTRTLNHVMATDVTKQTFAQIIDGQPAPQAVPSHARNHPMLQGRTGPSPESVEAVEALPESLNPEMLHVDSDIAQAYQNTVTGSREFKIRLLEMIAVTFHNTSALLFDTMSRRIVHVSGCLPPDVEPPPTVFIHRDYRDHDQYPLGVADMVGYWAEYQVFGGVVLFGRGESEREALDVYIHPPTPWMIFKLSDSQVNDFIDFGLSNFPARSSISSSQHHSTFSLPFAAERYAERIDPDIAIQCHHIFRNKYERKPFTPPRGLTCHRPRRLEDDPVLLDLIEKFDKKEQREEREGGR
ncbi:hypothetical protein PRK78_007250 [Emydomyces testavorans]|uniref:Uncharacterized protein n=1 Tax=Emydomyces testavorans TaxID=2070801 RepID=A0AAF0DMV4_9EURO|nr:hypothetical protein PRK78_007250 [Emydomyces testavorans]